MAIVLADRVQETSTTTGTGTFSLAGAKTGYQGFVAGAGDAAVVPYCIVGQAGGGAAGEWETGYGTVTDAGTDTLSRDTVLSSSNADAAVNFSAGTKDVFLTAHNDVVEAVARIGTYDPSSVANLDIDISGYDSVVLTGWLTVSSDGANVHGRFSNDGGSTFRAGANDYTRVYMHVNDVGTYGDHGDATADHCSLVLATGNVAGEDSAFHANIIGAYTASVKTRLIGQSGVVNGTPNFQGVRTTNKVNTAEINDAVQLVATAGTFTGHVVAYGYRS